MENKLKIDLARTTELAKERCREIRSLLASPALSRRPSPPPELPTFKLKSIAPKIEPREIDTTILQAKLDLLKYRIELSTKENQQKANKAAVYVERMTLIDRCLRMIEKHSNVHHSELADSILKEFEALSDANNQLTSLLTSIDDEQIQIDAKKRTAIRRPPSPPPVSEDASTTLPDPHPYKIALQSLYSDNRQIQSTAQDILSSYFNDRVIALPSPPDCTPLGHLETILHRVCLLHSSLSPPVPSSADKCPGLSSQTTRDIDSLFPPLPHPAILDLPSIRSKSIHYSPPTD